MSGTRSVCLSLWKVDDTATALLMQRFYQNLLGRRPGLTGPPTKAEALAESKRWLRALSAEQVAGLTRSRPRPDRTEATTPAPVHRSYDHPYYWAAFVLAGDPD
jgi:CHAT domain-containing protein